MNSHSSRALHLCTLFLVVVFAACTPDEEAAAPAPEPPAQGQPIQRTQAPIPGPTEGGLSANHGGLVVRAGAIDVELTVDGDTVTIHFYDESGAAHTPSSAGGSLRATWDGGEASIPLSFDGGVLVGSGTLPAIFQADLDLEVDGSPATASLRWATGGTPSEPGSGEPQTAPGRP